MKITVSYQPDESALHDAVLEQIKPLLSRPKVHKSDIKGGFYHTYLTCKNVEKMYNSGER